MIRKLFSSALISLGLILSLGALGLTGYNLWDSWRAENASKSVLEQIEQAVAASQGDADEQDAQANQFYVQEPHDDADAEMPTIEIDGYRYIGVLSIPSLDLELPVMEEWDYTRMRIAPCRYSGSAYSGNLIIAGHNYSSHFGNLRDLQSGDEVFFTDMSGNVFVYSVLLIEILDGTAVEEMESGDWDLTMFTCTIGGEARVTVRCMSLDAQS